MFIKRKNRAGKAYTRQLLLSFKTSVAYKFFLNLTPDSSVRCEADCVGHSSDNA